MERKGGVGYNVGLGKPGARVYRGSKIKTKIAESKSWKRKGVGYRQAEMDRVRVYRGSKNKTKVHQTKSLLFSNEGACLGVIEEPSVLLWADGIGIFSKC